ncbi:hypothetical protein M426DRAFT_316864 [Hypoxylon sp. CI-4A]|nr:hypothetical protein M426DRAFT_316864 [Hypoxylon sp. CI-4A]
MNGTTCRRLTSSVLLSRTGGQAGRRSRHFLSSSRWRTLSSPLYSRASQGIIPTPSSQFQTRGKKTTSSVRLEDLPQGPLKIDDVSPLPPAEPEDEGPAYPTVVLQARRNMQRFDRCVLLTRVGGFYELYFEQAEEYGPLLNLKVASKKTNAGPVPMAGFPFFQLDRFLKTLVMDLNSYVAIAEEFPNDPGDKIKSNGLMHDRRVTRVITPGTLIDENFIDPYANNYVMAIHVNADQEAVFSEASDSSGIRSLQVSSETPIGLAWIDVSTGQFYTQSTTVTSLGSILSRVGPREVVVDEVLESHRDHQLFSVLAEDKHLITYAPHGKHLPLSEWSPMLESEIPAQTAESFTPDEVQAGSLLLQYVRDRLQGLSMKLQPPMRYEHMSVMMIDKSTMRSLEIKQTIRDGTFRGSLLHTVRKTVTKGGARLLNSWLSAPSTNLETITSRQDLVEYLMQHPDLRDEIVLLLRRSHDSQRLVQKFALGRGDPDDLIALANTIRATQDIVSLLEASGEADDSDLSSKGAPCFTPLLSRINLSEPSNLATRIQTSIDEEGLVQQHRDEDSEASQLMNLAKDVVTSEGTAADVSALPKSVTSSTATTTTKRKTKFVSIRDHYSPGDDTATFVMKPEASPGLRSLHAKLAALLDEKSELADHLRETLGAASLTLRWTPTLGHVCHVKGVRDMRKLTESASEITGSGSSSSSSGMTAVSSSRSTRAFHLPAWTALGRRIHQTRFEVGAEEQRLMGELRALVVSNLVKLRRNAAVLDELDVGASFARLAEENGWARPVLRDTPDGSNSSSEHIVIGGRHPTVEAGLREQGRSFTSNDCLLGVHSPPLESQSQSQPLSQHTNPNTNTNQNGNLWLITGPNMGGKSTYLRQNALLLILAQAGSFVPATFAQLPLTDAVYSRVGSADDVYANQSTFMVEMQETALILRNATPRSFVIMDEIGRGTTPEDGLAVAFAALHHLLLVNRCRALFATHYHGLADLIAERRMHVDQGGGVDTYCTDVDEDVGGGFVYVHKLRRGVNRQSHALKVARLAGLPEAAITTAKEVLEEIDSGM